MGTEKNTNFTRNMYVYTLYISLNSIITLILCFAYLCGNIPLLSYQLLFAMILHVSLRIEINWIELYQAANINHYNNGQTYCYLFVIMFIFLEIFLFPPFMPMPFHSIPTISISIKGNSHWPDHRRERLHFPFRDALNWTRSQDS